MTLEHAQAFRQLLDARPETLAEAVVEAANHGAECPQGPVSCVTCLLGMCLIYALGRDGLTIGEVAL